MSEEKYREIIPSRIENSPPAFAAYFQDLDLHMEAIQPGEIILDIAAGNAGFARGMLIQRPDVTVVSVDQKQPIGYEELPQKIQELYIIQDFLSGLDYPDESFDRLVSRAAMKGLIVNSMETMIKALQEAKRLLKPGREFRFGPELIDAYGIMTTNNWAIMMQQVDEKKKESHLLSPKDEQILHYLEMQKQISFRASLDRRKVEMMGDGEKARYLKEKSLEAMNSLISGVTFSVREPHVYENPLIDCYYVMEKL